MASEQTAREVIADAILDTNHNGIQCGEGTYGSNPTPIHDVARVIVEALDAAEFAIVRKPTGDRVTDVQVAALGPLRYTTFEGQMRGLPDHAVRRVLQAALDSGVFRVTATDPTNEEGDRG